MLQFWMQKRQLLVRSFVRSVSLGMKLGQKEMDVEIITNPIETALLLFFLLKFPANEIIRSSFSSIASLSRVVSTTEFPARVNASFRSEAVISMKASVACSNNLKLNLDSEVSFWY